MPIRIKCASCQTIAQVPDNCQGKKARCPKCGVVNQIPLLSSSAVTAQPAASVMPPPKQAPANAVTSSPPSKTSPAARSNTAAAVPLNPSPPAVAPKRHASSDKPWIMVAIGGGAMLIIGIITTILGSGPKPAEGRQIAQNTTSGQQAPTTTNNDSVPVQEAQPEVSLPPAQKLPKQVEVPADSAPERPVDSAALTRRVKKSTAYLKVTSDKKEIGEGSGFFAIEPGLVFTNAHVLGMLSKASHAPAKIEVVVNSGEPDEFTRIGHILGVDRVNDLGILRVDGGLEGLPEPLPVDSSSHLSEIQKVYVFGFPFGSSLGKNITISESAVSSLRKDADGHVAQVQVNGGMNPGNSGGPVVDTRGVVVGVAVSIIRGTQINFAVPGEKVQDLLRGHVEDIHFGERYLDNQKTKLPLQVRCLDPLSRLRDLKLEIWSGNTGPGRQLSLKQPAALPGDGPHQTINVAFDKGQASLDVPLPNVEPGKVLWVQPVLTDVAGHTHWAAAKIFKDFEYPPLVRQPALLQQKFDTAGERTVKLATSFQLQLSKGNNVAAMSMEAEAVETVRPDPQGGQFNLCFAKGKNEIIGQNTQQIQQNVQALELLRGRYFSFTTNPAGTVVKKTLPALEPNRPMNLRNDYVGHVFRISNSFELTCLPLPNREMQPKETWPAVLPWSLITEYGNEKVEMVLTCTYEGKRPVKGQTMAMIGLKGTLRRRQGGATADVGGNVTGKAHFAVDAGYLSDAKVTLEAEFGGNSSAATQIMEISLVRTPGNTTGIVPSPPPPNLVKGKSLLDDAGTLTKKSPTNYPGKNGNPYKLYTVNFEAGTTYLIELNKTDEKTNLDPYLILQDPHGKKIAEDDDSGGDLNSRIVHHALETGSYKIYATTLEPGQAGAYRLMVSEVTVVPAKGQKAAK